MVQCRKCCTSRWEYCRWIQMVHIPSALDQKSPQDQDMGLLGALCHWLMCYLTVSISRRYMRPSRKLKNFSFAVEKKYNPFWQSFCYWVFVFFFFFFWGGGSVWLVCWFLIMFKETHFTSLFNWGHLEDLITYKGMIRSYIKTILCNMGTRTGSLNGSSYVPPFGNPLAVLGTNVNKNGDLDILLFFNKYFHRNFLSFRWQHFCFKEEICIRKRSFQLSLEFTSAQI